MHTWIILCSALMLISLMVHPFFCGNSVPLGSVFYTYLPFESVKISVDLEPKKDEKLATRVQ